jgi:phosphoribosylformylglycinamidine synthase
MKTAVVIFPGSNCDRDALTALTRVTGKPALKVWHTEMSLPAGLDLIIVPGGFSYGDYLRSGAIAARSPVMQAVQGFAARGGLVGGFCNGFQVLTEAGLLPGALMRNAGMRFVCRQQPLVVAESKSPWTQGYRAGQTINLPIAHADGNYTADADTLKRLRGEGRIAFYYAPGHNPNGSAADIAGIVSDNGRVLGMMPHPERAMDTDFGPQEGGIDGRALFEGALNLLVAT